MGRKIKLRAAMLVYGGIQLIRNENLNTGEFYIEEVLKCITELRNKTTKFIVQMLESNLMTSTVYIFYVAK